MKTKARKRKQKEGDAPCGSQATRTVTSNAAPTVQPASAAPVLLTVTKVSNNPYMIYAVDSQSKRYGVRVQSSLLYNMLDKLLALPDQSYEGIMLQVGPRPNYKGEPHYRYRLEQELKKYDAKDSAEPSL